MILGCKFHILGIKTTLGQHIAENLPVYIVLGMNNVVTIRRALQIYKSNINIYGKDALKLCDVSFIRSNCT